MQRKEGAERCLVEGGMNASWLTDQETPNQQLKVNIFCWALFDPFTFEDSMKEGAQLSHWSLDQ